MNTTPKVPSSSDPNKERQRLLASLDAPKPPVAMKQRVIRMLAEHSETRDDDDALWEWLVRTYTPREVDRKGRISLDRMKSLPKRYDAQRARAHIQNSLGLYLASPEVQEARRKLAKEEGANYSPRNQKAEKLFVFCDESSKTKDDRYLVVGSVWLQAQDNFDAMRGYLGDWRLQSGAMGHEFHFSKLTQSGLVQCVEFFKHISVRPDVVAFRAVVLDQKSVRRSSEEKVREAHRMLLQRSIEFDVERGRLTPGKQIYVFKDSDGIDDALAVESLRQQVRADLRNYMHGSYPLADLQSLDSSASDLIQVADLFTGAVARAWRRQSDPGTEPLSKPKDAFTDVVCERLGLARFRPTTPDSSDFVMIQQLG